jgi:hypothetical protein
MRFKPMIARPLSSMRRRISPVAPAFAQASGLMIARVRSMAIRSDPSMPSRRGARGGAA